MVSYSCTVWGWGDDVSVSLALKWTDLSFGMRDGEPEISPRLLGKEFSHWVLGENLWPKEVVSASHSSYMASEQCSTPKN